MGIFDIREFLDDLQTKFDDEIDNFVAATTPYRKLNFVIQPQPQSQWCWAAVTVSIAEWYKNTKWTQCKLVNDFVGLKDCCTNGSSTSCNQPNVTSDSLEFVGHGGTVVVGNLSVQEVRVQVGRGRPIAIRIAWPGANVGHAVVLDGYATSPSESWVFGDDPATGDAFAYTYDAFKTSYGGNGTWSHTMRTTP